MSKSNTLFNYFKKTDTPDKKPNKEIKLENNIENEANKENEVSMSEDTEIIQPKAKRSLEMRDLSESPVNTKRRRVMILDDSDNSDDENRVKIKEEKTITNTPKTPKNTKPNKKVEDSETKNKLVSKIKLERDTPTSSPASKTKNAEKKVNLSEFAANDDLETNDPSESIETKFKHFNYEFLHEGNLRDASGRLKTDPDYDSRTLYVPEEFLKTVTPAIRQWWELKRHNFDVILFFKVGKFYELYHMDAVIAVKELNLTFMKGDYAHCGFPEIAYTRYADSLVSKGYKVGRVEQTETPDMMNERLKTQKHTKFDKTVRREVCKITTPGTKTPEIMDNEFTSSTGNYLFSIIEKVHTVQEKSVRSFGVCFVNTIVGRLYIGQFDDDRHCSKLRTTLAKYAPGHVLYEKNGISKETKNILDLQGSLLESLISNEQMMSATSLLRTLLEGDYFKSADGFKWPENFETLLSEADSLGLTPKSEYELAIHAMGGIFWCLKKCLIDVEILSMKNFEIYSPEDNKFINDQKNVEKKKIFKQKYMVLDSITLTNLEVIKNSSDGSTSGTLFERLDYCNTAFGKRLLKTWLVNPLCDKEAINDRLDAVEDFLSIIDKLSGFGATLKSLPDLERLLSKIHNIGNVPKDHPESRAIYFENDIYSKKKVEDLIATLTGLSTVAKFFDELANNRDDFKSKLLKSITTIVKPDENKPNGFPYLHDLLKYYKTTFDAEKAKKDGKITPTPGINEEYDEAVADIKKTEREFEVYLSQQKKEIGCSSISYFGTAKNRYQLEIPESKCKHLSDEYELTSSKKGYKRYWTTEIKDLLAQLVDAEDRKEQALRNTMKCLFKNFDNHFKVWNRAVQCLAIVDVLMSLAMYANNSTSTTCRPEILDSDAENPFVEIINGLHPSLSKTFSGEFIPNDIVIGNKESAEKWRQRPLLLVTGPNMGGKSTLMRQAGLSVILAQIGCYVPASSCRLTPVDRIFTRIGASDKILAGESTFFLELSETACILHNATKNSLVLIDELGRGTATYDGVAIAFSVIKELANNIQCLTLFSTHYHHLVDEFLNNDNVSLGHMKCLVEKDANSDKEMITFLYKFDEGACPKSHGFNAAHLADIPDDIIKLGSKKSEEFEHFTKRVQILKDILTYKNKSTIINAIQKI